MITQDSPRLFFALTRRLERVHQQRQAASRNRDDAGADRLTKRAFVLIGAIFTISIP